MDRLDALDAYGDDNWRPIRDALRSGDYAVVKQFHDANSDGSGCA